MSSRVNPFMDEVMDMDPSLLQNASIGLVMPTPMTEYPEIFEMIDFITENEDKPATKITVRKLSKNGQVKRDKMSSYLASKHLPSSGLKEVLKNPANFFFYLNDRSRLFQKDKKHFELGTFIHMAFLEPKLFKKVKVEPKASLASKEGCKRLCEFYQKLNRDKRVFNFDSMKLTEMKDYIQEQKDNCKFMMIQEDHKIIIDIVERNYRTYGRGIIPKIMKGAMVETSFYGVDEETGIRVKVRPDAFNIKENIGVNAIISVKSTASPTAEKFMSDTARFSYELSEGMYQEVISNVTKQKFNATIMIMVQTVAPYQPAVFWWSPEDLQNGKHKYRYALDTAKECIDKNLYPGYESLAEEGHHGIIKMKQPSWSHKLLNPIDLND